MRKRLWYFEVRDEILPTDFFPLARRASFTRVMSDPTTGDEQEVPNTSSNSPSIAEDYSIFNPTNKRGHLPTT